MKRKYLVLPIVAALCMAGIILFACLHSSQVVVLNPQGPIAFAERSVILVTVALASIVVLPVFFLLFFFAYRYRADGPTAKREHAKNWDHDNWIAEFVWWLVPAVIVIILAVIAWDSTHQLDPYKSLTKSDAPQSLTSKPINIEVVALDWKWLFIYPDQGIATVNLIELPENTPVHFDITSDAPMNSFWIPSLGGQIMAMPGMTTQLNLLANTLGTFNGLSSEISGKGFSGMSFLVKSVSSDDFSAWVQSVKSTNNPLTTTTYADLAKPSSYIPPAYYSSIDNSLYTTSVMKYLMSPM